MNQAKFLGNFLCVLLLLPYYAHIFCVSPHKIFILIKQWLCKTALTIDAKGSWFQQKTLNIDGILLKGPYPPCLCMADRALLAGYPRYPLSWVSNIGVYLEYSGEDIMTWSVCIKYHKISNIRHIISQNLNDCRLVLQMPLANPLKPGVKFGMKM